MYVRTPGDQLAVEGAVALRFIFSFFQEAHESFSQDSSVGPISHERQAEEAELKLQPRITRFWLLNA
jgi:hypothetical protein